MRSYNSHDSAPQSRPSAGCPSDEFAAAFEVQSLVHLLGSPAIHVTGCYAVAQAALTKVGGGPLERVSRGAAPARLPEKRLQAQSAGAPRARALTAIVRGGIVPHAWSCL